LAIDGPGGFPLADVSHQLAAGDDVVVQQGSEFFLVLRLEQGLQACRPAACRTRRRSGEDGERARAAQGLAQAGAFDGLAKGLERTVGGGGVEEVLAARAVLMFGCSWCSWNVYLLV
jgi:hypothetical protein